MRDIFVSACVRRRSTVFTKPKLSNPKLRVLKKTNGVGVFFEYKSERKARGTNLHEKEQIMTIEQAQHLRVQWQSKGFPPCKHATVESEYYDTGEATGMLVCRGCGEYLLGDSNHNL